MLWVALFLLQDVPVHRRRHKPLPRRKPLRNSQADRVRAAMAASLAHQRDAVKRQEMAIRTTPAGLHAAASFVDDRDLGRQPDRLDSAPLRPPASRCRNPN